MIHATRGTRRKEEKPLRRRLATDEEAQEYNTTKVGGKLTEDEEVRRLR